MNQGTDVRSGVATAGHRRPVGDFAGHFAFEFVEVVDFGLTFDDILSGAAIPPGGARIDVRFAGSITDSPLAGDVTGTDHLDFRPGLLSLVRHAHLVITTTEGAMVAAAGDGIVTPSATVPITEFRVPLVLRSSAPETAWADGVTVWVVGSVNPFTRTIEGDVFFAF